MRHACLQLDLQPFVTVSLWVKYGYQPICTGSVIITYAINTTAAAAWCCCPLQRLRSRFPLFLSEFPIELRQYPKGAAMPWHKDEQMFASPQWEVRAAACAQHGIYRMAVANLVMQLRIADRA
jgi:hypothetical protein